MKKKTTDFKKFQKFLNCHKIVKTFSELSKTFQKLSKLQKKKNLKNSVVKVGSKKKVVTYRKEKVDAVHPELAFQGGKLKNVSERKKGVGSSSD